jgi:hypothetical protein
MYIPTIDGSGCFMPDLMAAPGLRFGGFGMLTVTIIQIG